MALSDDEVEKIRQHFNEDCDVKPWHDVIIQDGQPGTSHTGGAGCAGPASVNCSAGGEILLETATGPALDKMVAMFFGGLGNAQELMRLDDLEATPEMTPKIQDAEIVSSCPPPAKTDAKKLEERVLDLLSSSSGEVQWRAPVPGKRCYVCDHEKRAVAPSRVSGVLLCFDCARNFV